MQRGNVVRSLLDLLMTLLKDGLGLPVLCLSSEESGPGQLQL